MNGTAAISLEELESTLTMRVVEFVRLAREHGFQAGLEETQDALRIARRGGLLAPQRLRWGLRALLCGSAEEWRSFDALFDSYWRHAPRSSRVQAAPRAGRDIDRTEQSVPPLSVPPSEADLANRAGGSGAGGGLAQGGASRRAVESRSDFGLLKSAAEMQAMEREVQRLARRVRRRLQRRWHSAEQGRRLHLSRTLRHSLHFGGMPLDPVWRRRRRRPPRLLLFIDVSRSMSLYSYFFLRFARVLLDVFHDAHAFVFHTRLVPVSEALRERDAGRLGTRLALLSLGWAGGTCIGESLRQFNEQHGRRLLGRRPLILVVSDGLDAGPPALLAGQLALFKRRARHIVWVNPLLGRAGYQPLAGGMAAALPLVDAFVSAHDLNSLAALASELAA